MPYSKSDSLCFLDVFYIRDLNHVVSISDTGTPEMNLSVEEIGQMMGGN